MSNWLTILLGRSPSKVAATKKVTLEFTETAYQVMEWCAQRQNKKLDEWIHDAIQRAVPGNAAALQHGQQLAEAAMAIVHSQLDGNGPPSPRDPLPILSSSVDASVLREPVRTIQEAPETPNGAHPCAFLLPTQNQHYAGMSEGTCDQPQQAGRVCFWGASSARQCPVFKAKRVTPSS
jgi:hypothetical protein